MNRENLIYLILGAAIPVILPTILKGVAAAGEAADETVETNDILKMIVDEIGVPALERFLDEIKKERGLGAPVTA